MHDELKCNVCKQPALGVASSTFGAISFAYCRTCLNKPAEPLMIFHYLYYDVGTNGEGLRDLSEWYSFRDGQYLSWTQFCEHERALGNPGNDQES